MWQAVDTATLSILPMASFPTSMIEIAFLIGGDDDLIYSDGLIRNLRLRSFAFQRSICI